MLVCICLSVIVIVNPVGNRLLFTLGFCKQTASSIYDHALKPIFSPPPLYPLQKKKQTNKACLETLLTLPPPPLSKEQSEILACLSDHITSQKLLK